MIPETTATVANESQEESIVEQNAVKADFPEKTKASSMNHDVEKMEEVDEEQEEEEQWGSRWSFILAAVGSAIGLGNFWRFPYLAFRWGGGAFFIPYCIALFFVGIPLMQLEMALGQIFRRSATQAFGLLHWRWRGIGLGAGGIAFIIVGFYSAVLGWGNVYFVQSFYNPMPWSIEGVNGTDVFTGPTNHFFGDVLQLSPSPLETKLISSSVYAGAFFQWASVFLILWKGAEFISKAVWVTVLLPVVMLLILLFVGISLDGAGEGIKQYIGKWDMSLLKEGDMWVDAFSQIFFSLSLSTGVMTAYASMNPKNANIAKDAIIVSVANCFFSFLAGFAVFSVAGYMSKTSGIPFDDPTFQGVLGGPKLAFIAYPSGLSLVGGAAGNFLNVLFFITFYFLGVDSAFSLVESVVMNWRETELFGNLTKQQMTMLVCALGFATTTMYCSDIGLYLLDIIDDYASSLGLLLIGFFECLVAGWVYNRTEVANNVGGAALLLFEVGVAGGFTLFTILSISLGYNEDLEQSAVYGISFGLGLFFMLVGIVSSHVLGSRLTGTYGSSSYYLFLHGPESLRNKLNEVILDGKPDNMPLTIVWSVLLKFVMTPILEFLIINRLASRISTDGYDGYPWQYQLIGALFLSAIFLVVAVGWCAPHLYRDPRRKEN